MEKKNGSNSLMALQIGLVWKGCIASRRNAHRSFSLPQERNKRSLSLQAVSLSRCTCILYIYHIHTIFLQSQVVRKKACIFPNDGGPISSVETWGTIYIQIRRLTNYLHKTPDSDYMCKLSDMAENFHDVLLLWKVSVSALCHSAVAKGTNRVEGVKNFMVVSF